MFDIPKMLRSEALIADEDWIGIYGISPNLAFAAADLIEKLEAALRAIGDLDIPRPVAIPYRDDGRPSKHDRCPHGGWMYDECAHCVADYARKALGADD
jgi:hypothetical protein